MGKDCFGYDYIKREFAADTIVNLAKNEEHYLEEWKAATSASQDFDKMLIDLRKYGFSIITGLITAGSFLGISFSDTPGLLSKESGIIHIGVMNVTMFLILILFWLDIYYQNLLYGSVLRTRILEFFRLNYRLSIYISGIYTGSSMGAILYLIYGGFLVGVLILGIFVSGIVNESDTILESASTIKLANNSLVNSNATTPETVNPNNNKISINIFSQGMPSLLIFFSVSAGGMILIVLTTVKSRNDKLKELSDNCKPYLKKKENGKLTEQEIMQMENDIYKSFKFKV